MLDKLASNRVIKLGIVCADVDDAARRFADIFEQKSISESEEEQEVSSADYSVERGKEYCGRRYTDVPLKVKTIGLEPIYLELIQPMDQTPSPWRDYLDKYGTGVCFISFYIEGFEQHIDLMGQKGYPAIFTEEKGYERYAYFDTMEKLGVMLEVKEQIPRLRDCGEDKV